MKNMKKSTLTKDKNFWFVSDFETITQETNYYKNNNDTRVIYYNIRNYNNEKVVNEGLSIEEFMDYLFSLKKSCTIFFHNLAFDGCFIAKWLAKRKDFSYDYSHGNASDRDSNKTFFMFRNGKKIYYIYLRFRTKTSFVRIIFRCSYLLLSSGIEALGKPLGINKHNDDDGVDFYNHEPQKSISDFPNRFIEYAKNDTLIQVKSIKNFVNCIKELKTIKKYDETQKKNKKSEFNVLLSFTIASLSFRIMKLYVRDWIFKHNRKKQMKGANKVLHLQVSERDKYRNWFRGGWTQFNPDYQGNFKEYENIFYIDVNSAYPYQMTQPLPYGNLLDEPPNGDYITFIKARISKATIKPQYTNLLTMLNWDKQEHKVYRYVREITKSVDVFYTLREWELLNKYYNIDTEYYDEFYCKSAPYLRDYVNELYKKRQDYGAQKNEAFKFCIKILLNSGYGCLAQRDKFDSYVYVAKDSLKDANRDDIVVFDKKEYYFKYLTENYELEGYDLGIFQPVKDKEWVRNVLAASVITANQRCYLWETIDYIGVDNYAYCDTDSIVFCNLNQEQVNKLKEIEDRTTLGKWKIEDDSAKKLAIFGAKKYLMENDKDEIIKFGFAGIGGKNYDYEQLKLMNFNDDFIELKQSCTKLKECKSGWVIETIDKKIRRGEN